MLPQGGHTSWYVMKTEEYFMCLFECVNDKLILITYKVTFCM